MKKIIIAFSIIFSTIFLTSFKAFAQAETNTASVSLALYKIQSSYNRELIATLSQELLDNPAIGWESNGLLKTIFTICFLIALVQALSKKDPQSMLRDMVLLAFYGWLVAALMGGPTYERFSFLQVNDPNYVSSSRSLDIDIFNFFAYQADSVADSLFGASTPQKLATNTQRSNNLIKNVMTSREHCKAGPDGTACQVKFFVSDRLVDPSEVTGAGVNTEDKKSGGWGIPDFIVQAFWKIMKIFGDYQTFLFSILLSLVDLIRALLNLFIVVAFGMITGISFFLLKFMFPFAIMPRYRGLVWSAAKIPLSATLYGFCTSLIVYISAAGISALNSAAANTILKTISTTSGAAMAGNLAVVIPYVGLAHVAGTLLFAILQIYAFIRIPELSKDLLNLSLNSVVGFAKETFSEVVRITGSVAGAAAGGAIGGAAANYSKFSNLLGGGAGGAAGGVANLINSARGFFGAGSIAGPSGLFGGGSNTSVQTPTPILNPIESIAGVSLGTAAQSSASAESMLGKDVKAPDKNAKVFDFGEEKVKKDKKSRNPASSKSDIGGSPMQDTDYGQAIGSFISDAMSVGAGSRGAMQKRLQGSIQNLPSNIENLMNKDYKSAIANSELVQSFQKNYKNKTGALDSERVGSIQSASSFLESDLSNKEMESAQAIVSKIKNQESVDSNEMNELARAYNFNGIKNEEDKKLAKEALEKDVRASIEKIKNKTAEELDFEKVYKAEKSGKYADSQLKEEISKINENRWNEYSKGQSNQNQSLMNSIKAGLDSDKGAKAYEEMSNRIDQGYFDEDAFRGDEEVKNQMEAYSRKLDDRVKKDFEKEVKEVQDLIDKDQLYGNAKVERLAQLKEMKEKNSRIFMNSENESMNKYRELLGEKPPVDKELSKKEEEISQKEAQLASNQDIDSLVSESQQIQDRSEEKAELIRKMSQYESNGKTRSKRYKKMQKRLNSIENEE